MGWYWFLLSGLRSRSEKEITDNWSEQVTVQRLNTKTLSCSALTSIYQFKYL